MTEGSPVRAHVIMMMGYIQTLEKLGFPLKDELATDVILQSFPDNFKPFVLNFNMNEITSETVKETVWIKKFTTELRVITSIVKAIELRYNKKWRLCVSKETQISSKYPNTLLRASISSDEMWEYQSWRHLPPTEKASAPTSRPREDRSNSFLNRREFGDFALKFDLVNYVEVEMIFLWRLKIQEHREVSRFLISPVKDSNVVFSG
ncbi:hypothetical protein V6N13_024696 [Hibiscus sabdariffa]